MTAFGSSPTANIFLRLKGIISVSSKTETLLSFSFVMARSGNLSLLKSPVTIEVGFFPP
jgi:hypothetical protein